MASALLDALFPPRCQGCRAPGSPFCPRCSLELGELQPPWCHRCGRPLDGFVDRCADCPPSPLAWARAPLLYEGPVRRALLELKFRGRRAVAVALAPVMARALREAPPLVPDDATVLACARRSLPTVLVTWVPLSRSRRRDRGFDQAEVLARAVARAAALPVRGLLARTMDTEPPARRAGADRRSALAGAFEAVREVPCQVLLVDDVLTTGATAAECARALVAAGASSVGALTAARSLGGALPARCYNQAWAPSGSVVARETFSR